MIKTLSKAPFAIIRPKLLVLPRVLREQPTLELFKVEEQMLEQVSSLTQKITKRSYDEKRYSPRLQRVCR